MLIVDAQIHLWRGSGAPPHHRASPYLADEAVAAMDAAGVDASINCPAIWDASANDYAVEAALRYPERLATMGWFPLDQAPEPDFVEAFLARPGMLGLRFVIARPQDAEAFAEGALDWIWSVAERRGAPVAFGVSKPSLPAVVRAAERFPGVRFLLDHLGVGPFEKLPGAADHMGALATLAALPNVAVKASATPSMSNRPYPFEDAGDTVRRIFDLFGPDRFFWGTDATRMAIPLGACVTHFTERLPWLAGRDLDRVMGAALCDWVGWNRSR